MSGNERFVGLAHSRLKASAAHHLPCRIAFDGSADVEAFFRLERHGDAVAATVRDKEGNALPVWRATLRGKQLLGAEVNLAENDAQGYVFERRNRKNGSSEDVWDCAARFEKIMVWNHDRTPNEHDEARQWSDYLELSRAINI